MEARASDDDARLFFGEFAEYLSFSVIYLFRGDFTVFCDGVAHLAAQAELLVILAEIAPPVGLLSSDALDLLNGKIKLLMPSRLPNLQAISLPPDPNSRLIAITKLRFSMMLE